MQPQPSKAPLIAIIGPDGSGKSTVGDHITAWIGRYGPARRAHLGKQAGNTLRSLGKLPLIGALLQTRIQKKVDSESRRIDADIQPGLAAALVIAAFTLRRRRRFRRMVALREQGFIIVTDRYPQIVIPRAYDGPGFPDNPQGSPLVLRLARFERETFEWMASYEPDLVIRLNVDIDTACARKPDHRRESLARKIAVTPLLRYGNAPIVDIDASRPLDEVLRNAEEAVSATLLARGWTGRADEQPR